jgi:uncharacterized RDD family membrane protein YckC
MTQIPAGWYPDPDPAAPEPRGQRYWDGQRWTTHLQAPAAVGLPYPATAPYGGAYAPVVATTPDGERLAGWWQRVAAYLIDGLILVPFLVILGLPWLRDIVAAYGDFFDEMVRSAEAGETAVPSQLELMTDLMGPFVALTLVSLAVNFVYNALFLRWKAATPGKLAIGLRVRLREAPGRLAWSTIVRRWLGQNWYQPFNLVPIVGGLFSLYPLLDGLWPLWDDKRQALHDKVAATNVVRTR